jgi:hypothetical protein
LPPVHASLDRASLATIAMAGGGRYFELDRDADRDISNQIIDGARRRSGAQGVVNGAQEIYWQFLLAAAVLLGLGTIFLQERAELWLYSIGTAATLAIAWTLTR